jgi:hypothetical protein
MIMKANVSRFVGVCSRRTEMNRTKDGIFNMAMISTMGAISLVSLIIGTMALVFALQQSKKQMFIESKT